MKNPVTWHAFIFNRGLIWFGWILSKEAEEAPLYYDNTPVVDLMSKEKIIYATFGLRQKSVYNKLAKYIDKALPERR